MSLYNKESPVFFKESMISIFDQTYLPSEIVLIKDGFINDDLLKVIDFCEKKCVEIGVSLVLVENSKNIGLARSLDKGLKYVSSSVVARMDTDDINKLDRFGKQIEEIEKGIDFVYSSSEEFFEVPGDLSRFNVAPAVSDVKRLLNYRNPIVHPSIMFKKNVVESLGGYRDFVFFEDYDLFIRVFNSDLNIKNIVDPLIFFRVNSSHRARRSGFQYFKTGMKHKFIWFKEGRLSRWRLVSSVLPFFIFTLLPVSIKNQVYGFLRRV
nr:glycosyltransferase [Pontibacterium sinense]